MLAVSYRFEKFQVLAEEVKKKGHAEIKNSTGTSLENRRFLQHGLVTHLSDPKLHLRDGAFTVKATVDPWNRLNAGGCRFES